MLASVKRGLPGPGFCGHKIKPRTQYDCKMCDFKGTKTSIKTHRRKHKEFFCSECQFKAKSKPSLVRHEFNAHGKFDDNMCEICCHNFHDLKTHMELKHLIS